MMTHKDPSTKSWKNNAVKTVFQKMTEENIPLQIPKLSKYLLDTQTVFLVLDPSFIDQGRSKTQQKYKNKKVLILVELTEKKF